VSLSLSSSGGTSRALANEQRAVASGLERYASVFAENDIDFRNARTLSEVDLKELGLTLGHRRISWRRSSPSNRHPLWAAQRQSRARRHIQDALALAQALAHPFSLVHALDFAAWLHQYRREERLTQERAETDVTLATEQGIAFFLTHGSILRGWALVEQGLRKEGIAQIHQGLAAYRATGAELERPYWLALLAEAYGKLGQTEEGLSTLEEALLETHRHGWRFCEAELYRLKGWMLSLKGDLAGAEQNYRASLDWARQQQAKSWELRTSTSLARLWQSQGKRKEALDLLKPIYDWFTEGFDTRDLIDAKALLEELAR
jgi:predicted ATPase